MPKTGKGNAAVASLMAAEIPISRPCFHRPGFHPAGAMSVVSRVRQNSPLLFPPTCPTRSISTDLGTAAFRSAHAASESSFSAVFPAWCGTAPRIQLRLVSLEPVVKGYRCDLQRCAAVPTSM